LFPANSAGNNTAKDCPQTSSSTGSLGSKPPTWRWHLNTRAPWPMARRTSAAAPGSAKNVAVCRQSGVRAANSAAQSLSERAMPGLCGIQHRGERPDAEPAQHLDPAPRLPPVADRPRASHQRARGVEVGPYRGEQPVRYEVRVRVDQVGAADPAAERRDALPLIRRRAVRQRHGGGHGRATDSRKIRAHSDPLPAASPSTAGSATNRQSAYCVIDVSGCGTDTVPLTIVAS
jgi:hypothetical protein